MKNCKIFTDFGWYRVICFGLIVLGCLIIPVAAADKLYSIDPDIDTLVVIGSDSLVISEIGPLGVNILNTNGIVNLNDNELLSIFVMPDSRHALYKINKITGHATPMAVMIDNTNGETVDFAESLARNPATGDFYIGYNLGPYDSTSDLLGKVNPATGEVSEVCSLGLDMDMFEFSPTGSLLYANDVSQSTQITQTFYSINPSTCTYLEPETIVTDNQFLTDMELLSDGTLVGVEKNRSDPNAQHLVEIDPETGICTSLGSLDEFSIGSLCLKASAGPSPAPEFPSAFLPAAMIIGFLGAVLLIQRTRKY